MFGKVIGGLVRFVIICIVGLALAAIFWVFVLGNPHSPGEAGRNLAHSLNPIANGVVSFIKGFFNLFKTK